jgi:hypothetical protein
MKWSFIWLYRIWGGYEELSPGTKRSVHRWKLSDVSVEDVASIYMVEEQVKLEMTLK